MLNIVIAGAGEVGRHIALTLSENGHNIILIDSDEKRLEETAGNMDVAFRAGSATNWQLLEDLLEFSPDFFLAMTNDDAANLVSCSIAKQLGYKKTVARVRDNKYLNRERLDFGQLFHIDHFISPELTVANDILKYILSPGSLAIEMFAYGAIQLRTIVIPEKWSRSLIPLRELRLPEGILIALIRRTKTDPRELKVIFPHGNDVIIPHDEVTIVGETEGLKKAVEYFGVRQTTIDNIVIVGGSSTSVNLAKLLEFRDVNIRLIEKDYDKCCALAHELPKCSIIHRDATDIEFLRSEKIGKTDLLVVSTGNDELNLTIALLGKEVGCKDVVVLLSNASYGPILEKLGINFTASPRLSAAEHMVSFLLSGSISSLVSLYENAAEIVEINVSSESKIIGMPLSELGTYFPKDFLVAMIQHRGHAMIATGNCTISSGDTVIVLTHPKHIPDLKKLF